MAQSGFESLLDALRQSGVDVNGVGGSQPQEAEATVVDDASSTNNRAGSRGASNGGGQRPPQNPLHVDFGELGDKISGWTRKTIITAAIILILVLLIGFHSSRKV